MRVAVLGAGYAGLTVARRLERSLPEEVDIVIVDESRDHLVQHELHRVIRHPQLADAITVPLEGILSRAEIHQGTVSEVDLEAGEATLETDNGTNTLEYDYGAVCLGSETEFYGLTGVEEYAIPLKHLDDAATIREAALDASGGHAIVGGGGLSGIQTAGELAALSEQDGLDLDVTLVEMADRVAPGFDPTFAGAIRDELDARGVSVETGIAVESADEETVHLEDGRSLPADVFVWTGGIRGPQSLGGTRRPTARDLRVSESTFVVGDAAAVTDEDGQPVPASAQTAVRQAKTAAKNITALVDGVSADDNSGKDPVTIPVSDDGDSDSKTDGTQPTGEDEEEISSGEGLEVGTEPALAEYRPQTAGWVVSIGDGAVAKVGPFVFSGELARAAKAAIGAGHLGSVGAIKQASELVAEELGWPTADSKLDGYEGKPIDILPTDPGSPSEFGGPFMMLADEFSDVFGSDRAVDLTAFTRETDPSYPGSAMERFQRTVFDTMGSMFDFSTGDTDSIEIDITDESESEASGDDESATDGADSDEKPGNNGTDPDESGR